MPIPSAPWIPARDADFDTYLLNYSTLITATPTNYGLQAGDAIAIAAQYTAYHAAYLLLTNPATNNAPNVAAKDVARVNAEAVVRPYGMRIKVNASVSDALKVGLGLVVNPATLTPIPAPGTIPILGLIGGTPGVWRINYHDSVASGKSKPYGSIGVELRYKAAAGPSVDPDTGTSLSTVTKSPVNIVWSNSLAGDVGTLWGRYVTRSGPGGVALKGPWSAPLVAIIT